MKIARLILLGTLTVLLLSPVSIFSATLAATNPNATAQQLKQTLEQLNALDQWFSDSERKRTRWLLDIQRSDLDIADLNRAVDTVHTEVNQTNKAIEEINLRNQQLQNKRALQAKLIGEHIAAAYRLSGQDFLKQLLNQESPDKFERMIRYHHYFSESRLQVLDEYKITLVTLQESNLELKSQREVLVAKQQRLVDEQKNLTTQRHSRAALISQLATETETKQEQYQRLDKDRGRLQQLLAELRRRANVLDGSNFVAAKGSLPMPVNGKIRHAFGNYRAEGRLRWRGIDIGANHGTPVRAVFRGRVVFSDWLRGFGLLTILDHGSDYMTLYGHADVLHKREGDWVESGESIASAGNSGGRTEPGVYFEVRHKGETLDPIGWVTR